MNLVLVLTIVMIPLLVILSPMMTYAVIDNNGNNSQNSETNQTENTQEPVTCWDNSVVENLADCPIEVQEDLQIEPLQSQQSPITGAAAAATTTGQGGIGAAMVGPSTIITDDYLMPPLIEDQEQDSGKEDLDKDSDDKDDNDKD